MTENRLNKPYEGPSGAPEGQTVTPNDVNVTSERADMPPEEILGASRIAAELAGLPNRGSAYRDHELVVL
jgi:hypothetical protein